MFLPTITMPGTSGYPMKRERYEQLCKERQEDSKFDRCMDMSPGMGLAPGGRMHQEIYYDPYGLDAWDQRHASRCFVTIANSAQWMAMTGECPPTEPPSAKDYTDAELPWFSAYCPDGVRHKGGAMSFQEGQGVHT
jgi:hypothetical protein